MRSEYEKLVLYTDIVESIIKDSFSMGAHAGDATESAAIEYAKETIEFIRRVMALEIMVKYDVLTETTEEK